MTAIQNLPAVTMPKVIEMQTVVEPKVDTTPEMPADKVEISSTKKEVQPPQISNSRLFFKVLTDEQISQINEAKRLPDNAKFIMNGFGGYTISNNFFNFRAGTKVLPEGFEVRKNIFGMAVVLPKGMEGAVLK